MHSMMARLTDAHTGSAGGGAGSSVSGGGGISPWRNKQGWL